MTNATRSLVSDLRATLPAWLVARLLVGISWVIARLVRDAGVNGLGTDRVSRGLMAWDGDWYRSLMVAGYDSVPLEGVRFFPGFVLISRIFDAVLPGGPTIALVTVANLGSLIAGIALYRLVQAETADRELADRSVWLLSCFPSAFVLVWGYAEGPFLAAAISAFLAVRRRAWWWASILVLVASLIRPTGLLLVLPMAMDAVTGWRRCTRTEKWGRTCTVLAAPVGCGAFVTWASWHFDDPLVPLTVHNSFRGGFVDPFTRLVEGARDLFGDDTLGDGMHLLPALACLLLGLGILLCWPKRYGVYTLACLGVALCAENLNSFERYALSAFPIAVSMAVFAGHRALGRSALALSSAGLVALASLAWVGLYVP